VSSSFRTPVSMAGPIPIPVGAYATARTITMGYTTATAQLSQKAKSLCHR
jgi:hypothetical protein